MEDKEVLIAFDEVVKAGLVKDTMEHLSVFAMGYNDARNKLEAENKKLKELIEMYQYPGQGNA